MRYAGMGRNEIDKRILVGIPKERDQWEDVGVDVGGRRINKKKK
jgi:hypothetical protein